MYPSIILHKGKERSVQNFHPWIFSGAVKQQDSNLQEGDIAEVYTSEKIYCGTGHFHKGTIVMRIISWEKRAIDQDFWNNKIQEARKYRQALFLTDNPDTNAYRLVHGEGDGLPGLIIDIYNDTAVIQTHTVGMHRAIEEISTALKQAYGDTLKAIYNKSSEALKKQQYESGNDGYIYKDIQYQAAPAKENGFSFHIDFESGQKTGFFLDQRVNRELLGFYSKGKSVLNTFCYSGGFSVYALGNGATLVHSVDSSKKAIELTDQNVNLNFSNAPHQSYAEDVFSFLKNSTQEYDIVILDPPAFAKHLSAVKNAMTGYRNLNYEGIKKIRKGGLLFTFSCSQAIDNMLFRKLIFQAAAMSGRQVRIMHQLSQPADHPVSIYHPEGEYLKGLVLYID